MEGQPVEPSLQVGYVMQNVSKCTDFGVRKRTKASQEVLGNTVTAVVRRHTSAEPSVVQPVTEGLFEALKDLCQAICPHGGCRYPAHAFGGNGFLQFVSKLQA